MFSYSQKTLALLNLISAITMSVPALAVQEIYTDEATYLADLATMGYVSALENFEDDNFWGLLEPATTTTVPGVTSQGVRWMGLGGGVDLGQDLSQPGDWVLESAPPNSPFDGFLATAEQPLFGFGGWLRSSNAGSGGQNDVSAFLNGSTSVLDGFGVPTSNYVFWGVIDTAGITSIQFETEPVDPPEPGSGDPIDPSKAVLLDNFTLGFAVPPSLREPGTAWANVTGGTYATGDDWNGGAAPVTTDNALFHLGSAASYTVNFSQSETASQAVIANDKVTFDLSGFQYNLTEPNITRESLIVGERPGDAGELTITNGTINGVNTVVAHSTSSTGHLTIDTGAAVSLSGVMRVGSGGNGMLDVHNGGTLTSTGENFIGQLGGNGIVNVDGAGAAWNLTGFGSSIVLGSGGGTGELNVTDGASLSATLLVAGKLWGSKLTSDTAGSGTINVAGAGTTLNVNAITLALDAGSAPSTMNVTEGAQIVGTTGTIAISEDANVVLDGAGSSWTMNIGGSARGTLQVGKGDQIGNFASTPAPPLHTGTLTIQNGASVQAEESFIGRTRTGRGVLTVTGSGSLWTSGSQFSGNTFIGYEGDGELNVLDGGSVQTGQAFVGRFGLRDRLRGVANVDGVGSNWTTPSTIWVGFNNDPQIYFGAGIFVAEGVLNVTGGGMVSSGRLSLADRKISIGIVNITGNGSAISTDAVTLGKPSTSTFTFGSNAEMTIADSGLLDVTNDIDIHHGMLTLDDGTINATNLRLHGEQLIDPAADQFETGDTRVTLTGNGQINANVINEGGFVEPGLSIGALYIAYDYTQAIDGTLSIELGGTDNSDLLNPEYDRLLIDGVAMLGGTLDVSLVDLGGGEFVPAAGDSFGFLSATGGFGGTFDTMNLPVLSSGLQWQLNPGGITLFLNVVSNLTADFDSDGDVDAADLVVWESSFGNGAGADADGDGDSDGADLLAWQQQLGSFVAPTSASSQTVPEPHSVLLASWCALTFYRRKGFEDF